MKKNMGTTDKVLRALAALLVIVLYYNGILSGTTAIVLLIVAGVFLLTSFVSFCPLYVPFGISTRKKEGRNTAPKHS